MANGGIHQKDKKYEQIFEYEDYGTPSLYIWSVLAVLIMLAVIVLFGMIVAGGAIAVSEAING